MSKQQITQYVDCTSKEFTSPGYAICYSGYRDGQNPRENIYPSYEQVKQDLFILAQHWSVLRLYDCSHHAELVLEVITKEKLNFTVMLGADIGAEVSNPNCPWGAQYSKAELRNNTLANSKQIDKLIELANQYPKLVFAVSIGNEASVDWTDHMVPVECLAGYARRVKAAIQQPVTFCENYIPWTTKLGPLIDEVDFISIHTYPAWEYLNIDEALEYTKQNYYSVADAFPHKPVVITEAGWTTVANDQGIDANNASEEIQAIYFEQLMQWTQAQNILTFVFEAFDEPWKGSADPLEPEKHWGLFNEDRTPKLAVQPLYNQKARAAG